MRPLFFIDFETYSEVDPGECGAFEYSKHPSTEIVCAAWKFASRHELADERERRPWSWCKYLNHGYADDLIEVLRDPKILKVAWNCGFDRLIAENVLGIPQPLESWIDAAAVAAAHALPRNLAGACTVLGTKHKKNPDGRKLVLRYSKPKRATKKDPSTRHLDAEGLKRFVEYCEDDVMAMIEAYFDLPPLSLEERKVFLLNQRINTRGVNVDMRLLRCMLGMIERETKRLDDEAQAITKGALQSARQRNAVLRFLDHKGYRLPDLTKLTVENALSTGHVEGDSKRLLEIRQAISKTSTAKCFAFRDRTKFDGRVRDLQLYHGAGPGREAGQGVQPHNLPKPTLDDIPTAVTAIRSGDIAWVRAVTGDVMEAISSSIRGLLVPSLGQRMFCADYNAIEARVLLWIAGDLEGLAEFETGDPYKSEAVGIYKVALDKITDAQRDIGKRTVLGGGFQMGPPRFVENCAQFGVIVDLDLAKRAIAAYRKKHAKVARMWPEAERCAIRAVQNPGKRITMSNGKIHYYVLGKFLYCELPSGRRIAYFGPTVREEPTPWGEMRPKLYRWYQDSLTRQWVNGGTYGGELVENFTQGTARDIMVAGQLRTEDAGYFPLFSVHDECAGEKEKGDIKEFEQLMGELPPWATGLKLRVKGFDCDRYRKG